MEEWLLYHTLVGFDSFHLYDNTGSKGDASSAYRTLHGGSITKYGLPTISSETTDEELEEAVKKICSKFNAKVTRWPTPLYTSQAQVGAAMHHCRVDDSDYTAFIDMDEYVCFGGDRDAKGFLLEEVESRGLCGVRMSQRKMPHILRAKAQGGAMVWELRDTFEMETRGWAPKNILRTKSTGPATNIHELRCGGRLLDQPDQSLIRINHYNTNGYQMMWLKKNHALYDKNTPYESLYLGQSRDDHMDKFKEEMEKWDYLNLGEL